MKNREQLLEKLTELGISSISKKDCFVIKQADHNQLLGILKWANNTSNLFCRLNRGVIKIKFTR